MADGQEPRVDQEPAARRTRKGNPPPKTDAPRKASANAAVKAKAAAAARAARSAKATRSGKTAAEKVAPAKAATSKAAPKANGKLADAKPAAAPKKAKAKTKAAAAPAAKTKPVAVNGNAAETPAVAPLKTKQRAAKSKKSAAVAAPPAAKLAATRKAAAKPSKASASKAAAEPAPKAAAKPAPKPVEKPAEKPAAAAAQKTAPRPDPANDRPLTDYTINDPDAFASNLSRYVEESGKVWAAYMKPREDGSARPVQADEMAEVVKTLSQVSEYWLSDPKRLLEAQTRLWSDFFELWSGSIARVGGEEAKPVVEPAPGDRRFKDPDWSRNQLFDTVKQAYLLLSNWAEGLVDEASELDPHTRHKAQFYVKQIASAMAPTNFLGTNPELIKETLASNGENLVRGLEMLAQDIQAGGGDLKVRMTDTTQFKVGANMATTPGKVVHRNEVCELLQYTPSTDTVLKRPLLIVPPWINKFYILDLNEQKSFIKWAVAQGHTVFVISWINPSEQHAQKGFEHYMREGIMESLDVVHDITGERQANTIGYCVGGTLLSVTLAYMAATNDDRIASATLFTTQVDFTHAGDLKVFVDEDQLKVLEDQMARKGYLDGKKMSSAFNMLRANDLIWPYIINNYLKGKNPMPFDLLYWNSDSTRMPAANHLFYLRNCYLENTLSRGKMVLDGVKLDLADVEVPIYNLAAREDHIAPPESVFLGSQFFGGPVRYVLAGSGHIAGVINPPAKKKYQFWTGDTPKGRYEDWAASAEETPGSWWPDWQAWVEGLASERVPAREPGSKKHKPLGDAPGTYVLIKA